jgi:hypothetical protein
MLPLCWHQSLTFEAKDVFLGYVKVKCTVHAQESQDFDARWRSRVSEFEASVATQLCNLKQQHEGQLTDLLVRCETERPSRPQHSAEILNGRKIEEALVKQVWARAAMTCRKCDACGMICNASH